MFDLRSVYLFILFLLPINSFAQKTRDTLLYRNKYYQRVSVEFTSGDWSYQGIINDFITLEKGQITAEIAASTLGYSQINIGITKNIEFKSGVFQNSDGISLVNTFVGIKLSHSITQNIGIGVDAQLAYDREKNLYASTIAFGGQYQASRVNVGTSAFIKLGKNKVYDDIMLNSINFWGLFNIWRKGSIGLIYVKTINPVFYSNPYRWPIYLPPTAFLYYKFLFKRSILNLGIQYRNNKVIVLSPYNITLELLPMLQYNFLIKK